MYESLQTSLFDFQYRLRGGDCGGGWGLFEDHLEDSVDHEDGSQYANCVEWFAIAEDAVSIPNDHRELTENRANPRIFGQRQPNIKHREPSAQHTADPQEGFGEYLRRSPYIQKLISHSRPNNTKQRLMVDHFHDVMLVLFCNENCVGPEDDEEQQQGGNEEHNDWILTAVVFEVTDELIVAVDGVHNGPSVDGQQNPHERNNHPQNLFLGNGLLIDEKVEQTHKNGSKRRDSMHNIEGKVALGPAKHKGMHRKDEAADEENAELVGGVELDVVAHVLADGVGDECLHEVAGELRFDEGHVVLVAVDEAAHPEEVAYADHYVGKVVVCDEREDLGGKTDFTGHVDYCFKPIVGQSKGCGGWRGGDWEIRGVQWAGMWVGIGVGIRFVRVWQRLIGKMGLLGSFI